MATITFVKKTRVKHACKHNMCKRLINIGEMMIRESVNRWEQNIYCSKCGRSLIVEEIKKFRKTLIELNKPECYIESIVRDYNNYLDKLEQSLELINKQNIYKG